MKNVSSPLQNFWQPNCQGPRFRVRGSGLPSHINTWLQDHDANEKSGREIKKTFNLEKSSNGELHTVNCLLDAFYKRWTLRCTLIEIFVKFTVFWCLNLLELLRYKILQFKGCFAPKKFNFHKLLIIAPSTEVAIRKYFSKQMPSKISRNSQENTCRGIFLKTSCRPCNFI